MLATIESTLQSLFYHDDQRPRSLAIGAFIGVAGVLLGLSVVYNGVVMTFGAVMALLLGLYLITSLEAALVVLFATAILLPFGTLPFRVGFTPSLIETALGGFLAVYLFQWMTGRRRTFHLTPVSWTVVVFLLILIFTFVLGLRFAAPNANTLKTFVGLLGLIGFSLVLADVANDVRTLRRILWVVIGLGAVAAAIGAVLWFLPDLTAEAILNRLGRFGYPVGGVLHYREDGVSILNERAIGTWIAPNTFGGFLMMAGAVTSTQLFAKAPIIRWRWLAWLCFGLIAIALFLSDSRGSVLGLGIGLGVVAVLRYRRMLWLGAAVAVIAPFLPPTQRFIERLIAGFTAADLETQMRLGEYQDAMTLINRHPVFGVGFTGVSDIDIYVGASSTYLQLAAYSGTLGLLAFMLVMGAVLAWGLRWWRAINADDALRDIWLGLVAGIVGALFAAIVDHFYFNPQFQATSFMLWSYIGLLLATTRIVWERHRVGEDASALG